MKYPLPIPSFSYEELVHANDEWGCNCGPASIAAALGIKPAQVLPHLGDFEQRGRYMQRDQMKAALTSIGASFHETKGALLGWGLFRIQLHGPWLLPGVPFGARYSRTHWVAGAMFDLRKLPKGAPPYINAATALSSGLRQFVFDVNSPDGWLRWELQEEWIRTSLASFTECTKKADGNWSITCNLQLAHPTPNP